MISALTPELEARFRRLPRGLQAHVRRVQRIAVELANHHAVDIQRAELAALCHDIARAIKGEELLRRAKEWGIPLHPVEEALPILLHGPVGAEILRRDCAVEDEDVLEAVRWHTTSSRGLSAISKVVFLADKLDPSKASRYPYIMQLQALARKDLDKAMLFFLERELASHVVRGELIHPASVEARNDLLLANARR